MEKTKTSLKNDSEVGSSVSNPTYQQSAVSPTITKVEYSDGFGRLLQTRVQAEDVLFTSSGLPAQQNLPNGNAVGLQRSSTAPLNAVVSGYKIYNNKGKVVEQYEPYFDSGFEYNLPSLGGGGGGPGAVKLTMFYDALQRVTRIKNPDNSAQLVIYGIPDSLTNPLSPFGGAGGGPTPWENYTYDANDLAPLTNPTGSNVPVTDWYTPKSAVVDALGRTVKTTEHIDKTNLPPVNNIVMQYTYDVRGNLLLVKDPYNRNVFEHVYDLRPSTPSSGGGQGEAAPPLYTKHIDKGSSTVLFDATGKPIQGNDAKGARSLSAYDVLQRPTHSWANDNSGEATTLRQYFTYGDLELISPAAFNLNGKIYQQYDESGLLQNLNFDFKNNLLHKQQQTISDAELLSIFGGATITCYRVDWTGLPNILGTMLFETNVEYDALNRITKLTQPQDANGIRKEIQPGYNRAGALESIIYDGATYVEHIAYNAKGQRLLVAYGNNIMTRYTYNPLTFRLQRQRSESYTKTGWTYSSAGNVKQDTQYTFDLIGNITNTKDATTGCGVGGTNTLSRNFTYDPIYRVLSATGRENQPTITPIWDDSYRSDDNSTTTAYTQNYSYDKLGNIQQLQHIGTNSFTRNFNYTTNNNQLQNVQIGLTTYAFTYDACGNQLTETTSRHWEWDDKNMARCFYVEASGNVTQYTQYLYNAEGKRVKKLVWKQSGDFDSYTYIDDNYEYRINEIGREQTLHHVMDNESRLAIIREGFAFGDTTPAIKYNLQNFIGSSTVYLDNGGSNVNFEEYYPFGETSFGSYALKRYKYCGKERDIESGLIYYGARYCSAWTCRFVSVDPLAQDYMYLTPYNNAGNRPIIAKDIDGMQTPENKKDSGGGQTNNINSTNVGGKLTKADAGDETNPSINNSSSSSNNILSAPTGGANGFPDKILPKFDLKFLTKNNIANKPVDDGKPKFEALTPEKIFRINQTMQARAAYKTLSSYNDFELGMITSPVIQSIAQGGLAITGGAFINRSSPYLSTTLSNAYTNLGRGQYFVDGALNASSNFIGQLAFNNGNLRKVDYADLGFSFAFNKANIWHVGFNTSFSTMVDINAIDKPFLFFMNGVDKSTNRLGYDFLSNLGFNYGNMKFSQMVDKSSSFFVGKGTPFILNTMGSGFQTAGSNYIFDSKK